MFNVDLDLLQIGKEISGIMCIAWRSASKQPVAVNVVPCLRVRPEEFGSLRA
jgi:hypothetical protein